MKGFTFRLERILRLREDAEQRQARALGDASREEASLDAERIQHRSHVEAIANQRVPSVGNVTSAGMLRILQLTSDAAQSRLEHSVQAHEEAVKVTDAERALLTAASRDRKTLERLKEQRAAQWREDEARTEQKTLDEIAGRVRGEPR